VLTDCTASPRSGKAGEHDTKASGRNHSHSTKQKQTFDRIGRVLFAPEKREYTFVSSISRGDARNRFFKARILHGLLLPEPFKRILSSESALDEAKMSAIEIRPETAEMLASQAKA